MPQRKQGKSARQLIRVQPYTKLTVRSMYSASSQLSVLRKWLILCVKRVRLACARHWASECTGGTNAQPLFGMCCASGAVELPTLGATPAVLANLLSAQTARGRAFRENIRRYNVCLAMASSGGQEHLHCRLCVLCVPLCELP